MYLYAIRLYISTFVPSLAARWVTGHRSPLVRPSHRQLFTLNMWSNENHFVYRDSGLCSTFRIRSLTSTLWLRLPTFQSHVCSILQWAVLHTYSIVMQGCERFMYWREWRKRLDVTVTWIDCEAVTMKVLKLLFRGRILWRYWISVPRLLQVIVRPPWRAEVSNKSEDGHTRAYQGSSQYPAPREAVGWIRCRGIGMGATGITCSKAICYWPPLTVW